MKHGFIHLITLLLLGSLTAHGQLPLPQVPATLTRPADRADYIAAHFYDAMDWNDPAMTAPDALMQAWADYLSVLPHCSPAVRDSALTAFIHSVPPTYIPRYAELAEGYLFATDSELCDEATYLKALAALVSHPQIAEADRLTLSGRLDYLSPAAPGTVVAADTGVQLLDDSPATLGSVAGRTPLVLIVFFDPDCDDCHHALDTLTYDPVWTAWQTDGTLTVVKSRITDDTDATFPIFTVPALYLLDATTLTVLSRNMPLDTVARAISQQQQAVIMK